MAVNGNRLWLFPHVSPLPSTPSIDQSTSEHEGHEALVDTAISASNAYSHHVFGADHGCMQRFLGATNGLYGGSSNGR